MERSSGKCRFKPTTIAAGALLIILGIIAMVFLAGRHRGDPQKGAEPTPEASAPDSKALPALAVGRGLDIGSTDLVCAALAIDGSLLYRSMRNSYIRAEDIGVGKKQLVGMGAQYITHDSGTYVIGNPACELAGAYRR
jgi:hypothetical protein